MVALILVDIQVDFLPGGALAVPQGDAIIPVVNQLVDRFELVVATQDWHPPKHGSFAATHQGGKPFDVIDLNGLNQVLWPDHCVQGTAGAEFSREVNTRKVEAIFRKGMDPGLDSYSGFYDNAYRKSTGLGGYLKDRGVSQIYIAGLAADYCVYYTAGDGLIEGFQTYIVEDATKAIHPEGFEKAKMDIRERGGNILTSSDIR